MLEIDDQFFAIEEATEALVQELLCQAEVRHYQAVKRLFEQDRKLQERLKRFQKQKEAYENQKAFLAFWTDVRDLKRQLLAEKRSLDLDEKVIALRQAEVGLQQLLARVSECLAQAVSLDIFVDTGLPLAPRRPKHAKGRGNNIKERNTHA